MLNSWIIYLSRWLAERYRPRGHWHTDLDSAAYKHHLLPKLLQSERYLMIDFYGLLRFTVHTARNPGLQLSVLWYWKRNWSITGSEGTPHWDVRARNNLKTRGSR